MKHNFLFTCLLFAFTVTYSQFNTKMHVEYSKNVGDSFEIYISLPKDFDSTTSHDVVYYCDANLKSGKQLRELISTNRSNDNLRSHIFVGIGHIGDYHTLRRRDFILPTINAKDTVARGKKYGQTEKFYSFLQQELIPSINTQFKVNANANSIVGHSLGGLFVFFCLFKSDSLFSKYFALSPALWIDNYSIYRFNKIRSGFNNNKYLYFASGSKETINKILTGTNNAAKFFDEKKYKNFTYDYEIWLDKTHNSAVPLSLEKTLKDKL